MQAMDDPVGMQAAIVQRLFHRLLNELSRVLLMQAQDTHKFFHPASLWPLLFEPL